MEPGPFPFAVMGTLGLAVLGLGFALDPLLVMTGIKETFNAIAGVGDGVELLDGLGDLAGAGVNLWLIFGMRKVFDSSASAREGGRLSIPRVLPRGVWWFLGGAMLGGFVALNPQPQASTHAANPPDASAVAAPTSVGAVPAAARAQP